MSVYTDESFNQNEISNLHNEKFSAQIKLPFTFNLKENQYFLLRKQKKKLFKIEQDLIRKIFPNNHHRNENGLHLPNRNFQSGGAAKECRLILVFLPGIH